MRPTPGDDARRTLSWSVFLIACVAYVCLGWAEQGSGATAIDQPPESPLPFDRHAATGLDLREHSSLSALQWMTAAGQPSLGLVVIPIDADVVVALGQPEMNEAALTALDSLIAAGAGSPLAACLREPENLDDPVESAGVAVEALNARYPDAIAYVFACNPERDPEWQDAIAEAMAEINPLAVGVVDTMIPVSAGAPLALIEGDDPSDIDRATDSGDDRSGYVALSISAESPIPTTIVGNARRAILETDHIALVLVRPDVTAQPGEVLPILATSGVTSDTLFSGFTNAGDPQVQRQGPWESARVGTVTYLRTSAQSATLIAEFIGSDLHMIAVGSPNAGVVYAWVDPPDGGLPPEPDVAHELRQSQALDGAYPLFTNLSAARHTVVLVVNNEPGSNVMISGFFVSGAPETRWMGGLAAFSLLAVATATLSERCLASIASIRRATRPGGSDMWDHPREFRRRR